MSDTPVDEEALFDLVDHDPDFLETLVGTFLSDCSEYMDAIRRAVDEKDADTLVKEAHGLKGAVANLQARPALRAARRMEELGRSGAFEKAPEAFEELQERIDRLREALNEILRDLE